MSKEISILDCVPSGWTLRSQQRKFLLEVERNYEQADVFICNLPVSLGKTLLSVVVAQWVNKKYKHKSAILHPDNQLLDQQLKSFPSLHTLRRKDSYTCEVYKDQPKQESCPSHVAIIQKGLDLAKKERRTPGSGASRVRSAGKSRATYCSGCPYVAAMRKMHVMPFGAYTYHTALAYKIAPEVLILDEAHLAKVLITDLMSKKIWRHEYNYPHYVRTYQQLLHWVSNNPRAKTDAKLALLKRELESNRVNYLVERTLDRYHGEEREVLKLLPVDVSQAPPYLWPSKVKKLFLFSGTINLRDAEELGLHRRRLCYLRGEHPVPVIQRPLHYLPLFSLNARDVEASTPKLAAWLDELASSRPGRGFIHAPYSLALRLRESVKDPRFIFHTKENKLRQFQEWKESEDGILVASGMYEGISLDGDIARWQVITKVPWPNLGEPALKFQAEEDPDGYAYGAIRPLAQAYGRVCRSDTDFGETFLVDKSFTRLYREAKHLMPEWFTEAVEDGQSKQSSVEAVEDGLHAKKEVSNEG